MAEKTYGEFENLFRSHQKELLRLSYNLVRDQDAAKDIIQDVFIKLWNNREKIDFGAQIKHYLFKATAHTSYNYLRAVKSRVTIDAQDGLREFAAAEGEESAEYRELEEKVRHAIDRLPPKCRTIYVLCRHEGLKYQEIADTLGLSLKTVENQMGIALQKLRDDLKEYLLVPVLILILSALFFLYFF
jgi:RNA polymerase sigma-70 factor, ECF subfamily